jgi:fibronectin-binding autotransporter adhesin
LLPTNPFHSGSQRESAADRILENVIRICVFKWDWAFTGDVTDNGVLAFDRSDSVTFAGAISGTGALVQLGSRVLTLIGANTYSGGTTISAGTLQVGNGGTTGSIIGNELI